MTTLVELTEADGSAIAINPNQIVYVVPSKTTPGHTNFRVIGGSRPFEVTDAYADVVAAINAAMPDD
jgi:hypothetical protein